MTAFAGLQQNRKQKRPCPGNWPGLALAGCGLADLAREGISQVSLWVPLIWPLPPNAIPATLARVFHDSHCTFVLPLFISPLPVALPLKPYGSPLDKCF